MINNILDCSKIEEGKVTLEKIPFKIADLVRCVQGGLLNSALAKKLNLYVRIDKNIPQEVLGDPTRLTQILTNLLSNAVKFTEKGEVLLSADLKKLNGHKATIRFEVRDSGIGIPVDKLANVFESFTQAADDTTRKYGGTGLGLSIVKKLIELQGSTINVDSKFGYGTTFSYEMVYDVNAARAPEIKASVFEHSVKGKFVLIAEDNPINLLLLKQFLNQWEINYQVAQDGLEAIELVKGNDFDLVLMDIQMPNVDGCDAAKQIRLLKGKKYQNLSIIALTASALPEERQKIFESGINAYLLKPFNPTI